MAIQVAQFFAKAILADSDIDDYIDGRFFPIARSTEDEAEDKVPYIIMRVEACQNIIESKDNSAESLDDTDTIELDVVAGTFDDFVDLVTLVRKCVRTAFESGLTDSDWDFSLEDYQFTADGVMYDPAKPCYYQTLRYVCTTQRIENGNS